ncbi:choline ABC transporter permease subunit [Curvivirga aplysinae]|uniref:choline ABC transporter permease subunit n=1 Tax=Curvivirga aplysinae TaxID=2529852 RepID=UPI002E270363|nr:choline ABC transporter permease subunit [Curvivirga aplysinae]
MEWIAENKIPVGKWMANFVDFLTDYFFWFFDYITIVLEGFTTAVAESLLWFPDWIIIAAVTAFATWLHRSWKLGLFTALSLLFIVNLGYWEETIYTVTLVICATFVSMLFGVPLGVVAAHKPKFWLFLRPVLDMMQTIPTFVYLIPALIFFGLGMVPGLIATVIFAIPAPIRLTYLGISSVPTPLVEAAESFGATKKQLLFKVEIPHAFPTIMAGLTQCIMLSLSMVVIASMVGADGLGIPVLRALNTVNIAKGFEAGLAIVIVAILMDRICKRPAHKGGE